jgi:hypothetical protein
MAYELMLLADPGPERAGVLERLGTAPDVRPDPHVENRFWLTTPHGEAQLNIGTKDPVESIHVEFEAGELPLMGTVTRWALDLAAHLGMRVEDCHWGREVTPANLPRLEEYWRSLGTTPVEASARRPWWRFW